MPQLEASQAACRAGAEGREKHAGMHEDSARADVCRRCEEARADLLDAIA
ncbi:hypothetical protein [Brachybacterium tyrofermentans]|nr:Ferredoxin [Corynebacterium xerosis]